MEPQACSSMSRLVSQPCASPWVGQVGGAAQKKEGSKELGWGRMGRRAKEAEVGGLSEVKIGGGPWKGVARILLGRQVRPYVRVLETEPERVPPVYCWAAFCQALGALLDSCPAAAQEVEWAPSGLCYSYRWRDLWAGIHSDRH
jgi:hypothetical protein